MKILSSILIFYIFALSSNPCCDEDDSINENLTEHDSGDHDNNCTDICSPFFTCGSCTGFSSPPHSSSVDPELVLLDAEESISYLPFNFDYFNQIWQPPKIS